MADLVQTAPCNLCDGTLATLRFIKFGHQIVACRSCGLEFLHPRPTPQALADFYDEGYFTGDPERRGYLDYVGERDSFLASFDQKIARVEQRLARLRGVSAEAVRGRWLDVGTAAGWCVEAASRRGWDAWGVEVSSYAVEQARARGLNVVQGDSLAPFTDQRFDVITLWDALEHVLDPRAVLTEACGLLSDDGMLIFSTGDVGHPWSRLQGRQHRIYNPPQHVYYFSRKTMTAMARRAGLAVEHIEADEKVTTLHYVLHIARNLVDLPFLAWIFERIARVVPNLRVRMKLIDNLVVYATPSAASSARRASIASETPRRGRA